MKQLFLSSLCCLGLFSCAAPAERFLVVPTITRHEDPAGLKETNPGLAVEYRWEDNLYHVEHAFQGGFFRNSEGDWAPYAGVAEWLPILGPVEDPWLEGGVFLGGTWYESGGVTPMGGVLLGVPLGQWEPRVLWVPDVGQDGGSVAMLQLSWGF